MQVLEDGVPIGPGELVQGFDRAAAVAGAASAQADSNAAVRSVTGPRTDCAKFCRASAYCSA